MKKITLILVLFTIVFLTKGFSQKESKFDIEISFGYQEYDKRFWGTNSENGWGDVDFGIRINKHWRKNQRFSFKTGIGWGQEIRTHRQAFDHCFDDPGGFCTRILRYVDNYQILVLQTPIQLKYDIASDLNLGFLILPNFDVFKRVQSGDFVVSDFRLGVYSIEFSPTVNVEIGNWELGLGYRIYQLKTIDPVYLYGGNFLRKNPGYLEKIFDNNNPFKLFFTLNYRL